MTPDRSRLARLLQGVLLLQFAAVLGWLAWRWPAAPGQAVAGAVVLAGITPIVLAIEFVLLAVVTRHDTAAPRARPGQLARAWLGEVEQMVRVFGWRMPWRWRAQPDWLDASCAGQTGVVFIHGFVCNRGFWTPWMRQLRARGHAHVAVNLEPVFGSIDDYAPIVEAAVQRVAACTGRPPVLVCHSMGGLVARAWLRAAGPHARVERIVTIGSPHRGTWLGRFSSMPNGRQMRLDGEWLQELARADGEGARPPFLCWYSNCDNIVFPPTTATLPGADNRLRAGLAHVELAFDPVVMQGCLALLAPEPAAPKVNLSQQ